jgi:protein-disulfide reductase (glutathione)
MFRPMMVLIHQEWCSVCQTLKANLGVSKEFEELSKQFVMIDGGNDKEPKEAAFHPDGSYYPRVFFLKKNGQMDPTQVNAGASQYRYFPQTGEALVNAMKTVLAGSSNAA